MPVYDCTVSVSVSVSCDCDSCECDPGPGPFVTSARPERPRAFRSPRGGPVLGRSGSPAFGLPAGLPPHARVQAPNLCCRPCGVPPVARSTSARLGLAPAPAGHNPRRQRVRQGDHGAPTTSAPREMGSSARTESCEDTRRDGDCFQGTQQGCRFGTPCKWKCCPVDTERSIPIASNAAVSSFQPRKRGQRL
jgi:hypothetical protein